MKPFAASRLGLALRRKPALRAHGNTTFAATRWGESTHAELAWGRSRTGTRRWGIAGALLGGALAAVCFAPAAWLASAVAQASGERFLLADARGTVWSGSAMAVLTGGPGSRDASALPGRLLWTLRPNGLGLEATLIQGCCIEGSLSMVLKPGPGGFTVTLPPPEHGIGQWPAAWLSGLGTPWNTLQLGGVLRLESSGMAIESVQGRWRVAGLLQMDLLGASSRLSTLDTLGSYRFTLQGDPLGAPAAKESAGAAQLTLSTLEGALQLSGSGTWGVGGLRFRGEAASRDAEDAALSNLLNIIGRREGARSVISIG